MKDMIDQQKEQMPKAFFIASDALAVGALRALQEAGIAGPKMSRLFPLMIHPLPNTSIRLSVL